MEKVYSVLMSVYSKEKPEYLDASIASMINQTLKPDEIVIVKDGKLSDELEMVISKFVEENPGLFNIISIKENVGLGKALNKGLRSCKNDLVARMDTDDISLPNRCELQINMFLDNPHISIVGTMVDEFYDEPGNIISTRVVPTEYKDIKIFIRRRNPFNHPTVMYKKSDVMKVGSYGDLSKRQDLDLFSRMLNNGCIGINIDKSLLLFRSNEANFKRRKSWSYCMGSIHVSYKIWKRKHCSLIDLITVAIAQICIFLSPMWFFKKISKKYLRQPYQRIG